jgi:hypothetical protein
MRTGGTLGFAGVRRVRGRGKMIEVRIEKNRYNCVARIKPKGFWSDVVSVYQSQELWAHVWKDPTVSWSSGGQDGTVPMEQMIDNFVEALIRAKEIAQDWKKEREDDGYKNLE